MHGRSSTLDPKNFVWISLLISLTITIAVFWINTQIANRYETAGGKTRMMFFLVELTYNYKYFLALGSLISLSLAVYAINRFGWGVSVFFALLIALASFVLVFLRVWTLMV